MESQMYIGSTNYQNLKQKICSNQKLVSYFDALQILCTGEQLNQSNSNLFSQVFVQTFNKLTKSQKYKYLDDQASFINGVLYNQKNNEDNDYFMSGQNEIQVPCYSQSYSLFSCFRNSDIFKLNSETKCIKLLRQKKGEKIYDLKNYLVHMKENESKKIFLYNVSSSKSKQSSRNLQFQLDAFSCQNIYKRAWKCMMHYRNKQLLYLISNSRPESKQNKDQNCVFLKTQNLKQIQKNRKKLVQQSQNVLNRWVTLYQKKTPEGSIITIFQNRLNLNNIKLQLLCKKSKQTLKEQFLEFFKALQKRSLMVLQSSIIQSCLQERYKAIYQKLTLCGDIQQIIFIQEAINNEKPQCLYIEAIQNIAVHNYLQNMLISVDSPPQSLNLSELKIFCMFNFNDYVNEQLAKQYLINIVQLDHKIDSAEIKKKSQVQNSFSKVARKQSMNQKQVFLEFAQQAQSIEQFYSIDSDPSFLTDNELKDFNGDEQLSKMISKQKNGRLQIPKKEEALAISNGTATQTGQITQSINLGKKQQKSGKAVYDIQPLKNYNREANIMKKHYLFLEWKRQKKGGIICINQETLANHKKIFKQVLASLGNNILKGGNILNVSLPVTIFKKQSYLQLLGRGFVYAPMFLQGQKSPVQMVKWATLLVVSIGVLGISMDKPFFPFLGETAQLWIGGCPMYLEQIARHPPTTAYYFRGRGYKIFGQVEPKISFGVNSVRGTSQRPSYIQFDDGRKLQVFYPNMVIGGLLVGDRNFNFQDKIFVYDKTNHIFSELNFGPRSKGLFSKTQEPQDFFYGKIYQLNPNFLNKFESKLPRIYPSKQHIVNQLSSYSGTWNGKCQFDGKQYIDFQNQLPFQSEYQKIPLKSDSCFRPQIIQLQNGNVQKSQALKQKAQEQQRRDRKLRAQQK